jgi:hypothetical protein
MREVEENATLGNNDSLFTAGVADDGAGRRSRPQVGLVKTRLIYIRGL